MKTKLLISYLSIVVLTFFGISETSAAIVQRGAATTATTTGTTLTINKPTGVVQGDVLIVNIAQTGNNTTAPTNSTSGWTLIDGRTLAGGTARYGAVLYRVAGASESTNYTFTLGGGVSSAVGSIVAFSGVVTNPTPFDVAPGTISVQASSTAVAAASITTATANAAVIMFGMAAASAPTWSGWTTATSGALVELFDNQSTTATVGAAWRTNAATGATGAGAATLSAGERNGGILIALRPITIVLPATTTTVATSGTPTNYGNSVTFTATVTPTNVTGTVNFYDGATLLGAGALSGTTNLTATYTTTATQLSAAIHTNITAVYQGDSSNAPSTSVAITQTVNALPVTISSGLTANNKAYTGTTPATISSNSVVLSGVLAGDVANVRLVTNGYTANFTNAAVGLRGVTVSGLTLAGSAATNYTLTQPTNLSATITPATVTVTSGLTADNKPYDATTTATIRSNTVVLAGVIAGDTANVSLSTNGYTANFTSASAGLHPVTVSGLTLTGSAAGNYTLTQPTNLSATILAGPATQLAFGVQPTSVPGGWAITPAVTVQILDQYGNLTTNTTSIVLAIGNNPSSGTLSGTLTNAAINGTATFTNLMIDMIGSGYTLTASASNLTGAVSAAFDILPPDPDLPGVQSNIVVIPAGSLVIAMDNTNQGINPTNSGLTVPFNLRAYGLVNQLLQTNIGVKWAIRAGKAKDENDFTASVFRIKPSVTATSTVSFAAGPFIVDQADVAAALPVITAFGNNIAVYQLVTNTPIDIRYEVEFRPSIVVNTVNANIHTNLLNYVGITNYVVSPDYTILPDSCYSIVLEPHQTSTNGVAAIRAFVEDGGNFLAQCTAADTYENSAAGHFQCTSNIVVANVNNPLGSSNPDLAYSQFIGGMYPNITSVLEDWTLGGGTFINHGHGHLLDTGLAPARYAATCSKHSVGRGGLVFYLGGHDYYANTAANLADITKVNGMRMLLNAIFIPVHRRACSIIAADLGISKSAASTVGAGQNLTYTITVTNNGPNTATNVVVTDPLPAGTTFFSATGGGTPGGGIVTWPAITSLTNHGSFSFTLVVTAPTSGILTNFASVTSLTDDPLSTNDITPPVITTVLTAADVGLGKTGASSVVATSNLTYTISVTNFGPSTASSLIVTDSLPAAATFVSANAGGTTNASHQVIWNLGDLIASAVTNLTVTVKAPASGVLTNFASGGSSTPDGNSTNNTSTVITTVDQFTTATPLTNLVLCPGQSANFSTIASGSGPFTYVWKKNGIVQGSTSNSLTIASVSSSDAGTYTVEVTGLVNSVTNSATLTVNTNVLVTDPPVNQTNICYGGTATFTVGAVGTGLSYQWYLGTNILAGETNSVLSVSNVNPSVAGVYRVVLNGTCSGPITNSATLALDSQPPTITCPSDVMVAANSGCGATNVDLGGPPETFDNCSVASVTNNVPSSFYGVGTNIVIWTATDTSGNTTTCTQRVVVIDDQPPVLSCPENITVNAASGTCASNVTFSVSPATDNCGTVILQTSTPASGSSFPVGTTTVTNIAVDNHGNTNTCTFTVTVNDTQPPVLSCPENITVNAASGTCSSNVTFSVSPATDNCGTVILQTSAPASGSAFPVGTTTVTNIAVDNHGNTNTCTFTVTVNDTQPPVLSCPENITVNAASGTCSSNVTFSVSPATDNCGTVILQTSTPASGSAFPMGTTTVTNIAVDNHGNTNTCTFTVTVLDTPPSVSIISPLNGAEFIVSQSIQIIADVVLGGCPVTNVQFYWSGTNSLGQTTNIPYSVVWTNLPLGTYQLTAIATDDHGLMGTSAPVTISVVGLTYTTNSLHLNPQTSLYEQVVTVSNPTPYTLDAIAVLVTNKPGLVQLYNQTGTTNGFSYIGYDSPIPPGGYVTLTFKYYFPPGQPFFLPGYLVVLYGTPPPVIVTGTQVFIDLAVYRTNGTFLLNFAAISNKTYYIQYTSNFFNWKTSPETVPGIDSHVQWIDDGPPTTESLPMFTPYRFYRVIQVP